MFGSIWKDKICYFYLNWFVCSFINKIKRDNLIWLFIFDVVFIVKIFCSVINIELSFFFDWNKLKLVIII